MSWTDVKEKNGGNSNTDVKEINFMKLEEGSNIFRVLSEEPKSFWGHWIQQANGGKGLKLVCRGKGCQACEQIKQEKIDKVTTKNRTLRSHALNVYNRKTNRVEILEKGNQIFESMAIFMDSMGDLRNYDLNIVQTGSGFGNVKYTVVPVMTQTAPIPADLELYNLDEIYAPLAEEEMSLLMGGMTYEEMRKQLNPETDADDSAPAQEDEAPKVDFTKPTK